MNQGKYLKLNLPDYTDAADIEKLVENFEILEGRAPAWTDFSNSGTVLESTGNFTIATAFPVGEENTIFAVTAKMPRAFAEDDTITVDDVVYNLYQGTDPALSEAWKAGEVVTINFDKTSRRCWASAGGGAPRPLPAQVSNMQASTPEGETPTIVFTWTNPVDENFAGMILVVKEGSAPNGVTDGTQVYKGTGTTFTYTEGVQWERTYYGRGFAYNSQNKYQMDATGAIASATPSDVPNQVSDLVLTPNKNSATLKWTNPTQQSYSVTKVIQKIDSDPENPNDGTEVYSGTGTTVTVSNLQDSINYHFAVFAIGKNGKYRPPVVKTYTPEIWPKYDYTGQHTLIKDNAEQCWWRIKFLSSGVLTWLSADAEIDVFLVGGGGCSAGYENDRPTNGGGGGYTKTQNKIRITKNQRISIEIGAGGTKSDGGVTKFDTITVEGGKKNGNGGAGGGGYAYVPVSAYTPHGGKGGEDGADGEYGKALTAFDEETMEGLTRGEPGKGQGTTTREFGELGAELYSSGAGASAGAGHTPLVGGNGGTGTPILATGGGKATHRNPSGVTHYFVFGNPGGGYGGGGNGPEAKGAQGIVIIRDAREIA